MKQAGVRAGAPGATVVGHGVAVCPGVTAVGRILAILAGLLRQEDGAEVEAFAGTVVAAMNPAIRRLGSGRHILATPLGVPDPVALVFVGLQAVDHLPDVAPEADDAAPGGLSDGGVIHRQGAAAIDVAGAKHRLRVGSAEFDQGQHLDGGQVVDAPELEAIAALRRLLHGGEVDARQRLQAWLRPELFAVRRALVLADPHLGEIFAVLLEGGVQAEAVGWLAADPESFLALVLATGDDAGAIVEGRDANHVLAVDHLVGDAGIGGVVVEAGGVSRDAVAVGADALPGRVLLAENDADDVAHEISFVQELSRPYGRGFAGAVKGWC